MLHKKEGNLSLDVRARRFEITLNFHDSKEAKLFLDYAKKAARWSRDTSSLVPQSILEYIAESTKEEKARRIIEEIIKQKGRNGLALATDEEIACYIQKFWKEMGIDSDRFHYYPNHVQEHLCDIEQTVSQGLFDYSQITRIDLLNEITDKSKAIASSENRRRILYRELDGLLEETGVRLPTILKELIYETVKMELDPDGIAEFEEVASRPYF